MGLAAQRSMIWPTGIGDFLIRRGTPPELANATPARDLDSRPVSDGYLRNGVARPLRWAEEPDRSTSMVVLRFENNGVTVSQPGISSQTETEPTVMHETDSPPPVVVRREVEPTVVVTEQPPVAVAATETPEQPTRPTVLDENFVNWVTRRIDETKVEIPFQLPTDPGGGDLITPTERVRVRYREEP